MTTIYKTTRVGRRPICTLPLSKAEALQMIKQVADEMGWVWVANQYSVSILFKPNGDKATYSAVEEKITNFASDQ